MAYVLGFFAADGYITKNKNGGLYWCIQITDRELLYRIRDSLGSTHKISKRIMKAGEKPLYRLQIGSTELCHDLFKLGFNENKTKRLNFPEIANKYLPDFVRGYFDGDGNVWCGLVHKERKTKTFVISTVFTSCSREFLDGLRLSLESVNICKGVLRENKDNYHRLTYSVISSLKIFNFMYNGSVFSKNGLFLNRKKIVFEKYIKMRA